MYSCVTGISIKFLVLVKKPFENLQNNMKNLVVSTPSRLHFGLFAVGQEVERSFGGVGLMVKAPRTVIKSSASQRFVVRDLSVDKEGSAERVEAVEKVAQKWFEHFGSDASGAWSSYADLPIELEIVTSPLRHTGLGSGTQLAMASGLLLQSSFELPTPKPGELAVGLGRATRSAIGTYGCFEGGLIVDGGKTDTEPVSPIDLRVDFPDDWPIAIVHIVGEENKTASSPAGLHGRDEEAAFEKIPPTTPQQLEGMRALVAEQIVPGVLEKNYQQFAGGVYEFSRRSGEYFSEIQGAVVVGAFGVRYR